MAMTFDPSDPEPILRHCLSLARLSPPKPTNYRVGALLLDLTSHKVVSTGYTLELEGNTHAEQCALAKLATQVGVAVEDLPGTMASRPHALYTTVEPCVVRLSGNVPCVERILAQKSWVRRVVVGVHEPADLVEGNDGRGKLEGGGIEFVAVDGLEGEILSVAKAGHIRAVDKVEVQ
jgi:pyrimidine deaminase RibD-like protein